MRMQDLLVLSCALITHIAEGASRDDDVMQRPRTASVQNVSCFFFQAEDGIRDIGVTGVQTCALPILPTFWRNLLCRLASFHPCQPCMACWLQPGGKVWVAGQEKRVSICKSNERYEVI